MLSLRVDTRTATRHLKTIQKKQIPFATSQAINKTLPEIRAELQRQAPIKLDRPIRFTINAFQYKKSTKTKAGKIFIEAKRWAYLQWQVQGGQRVSAGGRGFGIPIAQKRNKYGNIPARRKGLIKNKEKQFIGTIGNYTGVWQRDRKNNTVTLMTGFFKKAQYKPRFNFYRITERALYKNFRRHFNRSLKEALRTAR